MQEALFLKGVHIGQWHFEEDWLHLNGIHAQKFQNPFTPFPVKYNQIYHKMVPYFLSVYGQRRVHLSCLSWSLCKLQNWYRNLTTEWFSKGYSCNSQMIPVTDVSEQKYSWNSSAGNSGCTRVIFVPTVIHLPNSISASLQMIECMIPSMQILITLQGSRVTNCYFC